MTIKSEWRVERLHWDDTDEQDSFILLDGTDSSSRDLGGFLTGEGGIGMAADLTITADADATMTVS